MRPRNLLLFVLVVLIAGFTLRVLRGRRHPPAEEVFVAVNSAPVWSRVAEVREVVVRVSNGERLWVEERRRGWAHVRTPAAQAGWIEERFLAGRDVFDRSERLARESATRKPQTIAQTRVLSNLHTEPGRNTPRLYQLPKGEAVEVLARAAVERLAGSPVAEKESGEAQAIPAEVRKEDWYLVRTRATPHRVGWLLARFVDLNLPEEIKSLVGEKRIVSACELRAANGEGDRPWYLVALAERGEGLPYDFSAIRVFTWNTKRSQYETAYVESGFQAFWPIEVKQEDDRRVFSFEAGERGQRVTREYRMEGVVVRRVRAKTAVAAR